jgi:hypothetical protein
MVKTLTRDGSATQHHMKHRETFTFAKTTIRKLFFFSHAQISFWKVGKEKKTGYIQHEDSLDGTSPTFGTASLPGRAPGACWSSEDEAGDGGAGGTEMRVAAGGDTEPSTAIERISTTTLAPLRLSPSTPLIRAFVRSGLLTLELNFWST